MSLLLDALRARKGKEEGSSIEPVEFNGPVINADEVLGRSDAVLAVEHSVEPSLDSTVEYARAVSQLESSTRGSSDLPDSVTLSKSVSSQSTTVSETANHGGNDKSAEIPFTDVDANSVYSIDSGDTEFSTTPKKAETTDERDTAASNPDELSIQFEGERVIKHQAGVDAGVSIHNNVSDQPGVQMEPTGTQADQQVRHQVINETSPGRRSGAAIAIARSMNPDPLFFVIIAFAFAGLFGSLYALVTQNDAFVSQEYTDLKARQSALNELITNQKEKDRTYGERVDSAAEQLHTRSPAEHYSQNRKGIAQSANEASKLAANEAGSDDGNEALKTTPVSVSSLSVGEEETDKVEAAESDVVHAPDNAPGNDLSDAPVPSPAPVVPKVGIEDLAVLQAELNELRASLAAQSLKISEVLAENSELRKSRLEAIDKASSMLAATGNLKGDEKDFSLEKNIAATNSQTAVHSGHSTQGSQVRDAGESRIETQNRSQGDTHGHAKGVNSDEQATDFSSIIGKAFHAYSTANLREADALYAQALQLEPYNRDANLGVAAVAMKTGNYPVATLRYRHLLSLDPVDVVAFSALLNLAAATRDPVMENEMILHSSQHRDAPALHAALGNYYSQTARWVMASQSYATAVGLSPDTADYLYNLAVTLDNLGDSQAAIETYERALALSETGFYTFSVMDATARLRALRGN